ncbi:AAA family ATPase [archaeon]|nr:AAA family ATPase [archaeon]MDD2477829.1 AAA family ATPase [Candidatus ainarchaeum sp.]MDD3084659.1 AAA family ATPase [Candidatus ainarchaeum sp.]MDD4221205.1 AAA family ATPase [Candidatus ainarchaeum sp.]MDD4662712.1 AAA family ATPase [Candidatus ainarchaeum sp.]
MPEEIVKLKVSEAKEDYVGKNIVTLDISIKQKLNLISGDVIEITGEKTTVAQVWPEKISERQENIIRMDQYIRNNADVSIGEFVTIKRVEPEIAHEIVLTPLREVNLISENLDVIIKKNFLGRPFLERNNVIINLFGNGVFFNISSTKPSGCVILAESTNLIINKKPSSKIKPKTIIGYEDVGGLKREISVIREMVELPFKYPEFFEKLNVSPPKGILLYGPPGTGKTLLAKALSNELKANFIALDAPQIMAKFVGEAEERLRSIFKKAQSKTPAIIFIDEIDAIAPKRDGFVSEVEKRVVAQLLALMDGVSNRGEVIVIGATNRQDDVDPALRRPGRFDREVDIGVPSEEGRLEILKIHTRNVPLNKDVSLAKLAKKTHGFVGADLGALVKEAAIFSIKNAIEDVDSPKKEFPKEILDKLCINKVDFESALKVVQPSALREIFVDMPDISFDEVGALKEQKEIFTDIINLSLNRKAVLSKMNVKALKKILLCGPPGTGKTMFVKATAKEFGLNFIYVKGPEVFDKWLGESEKAIRDIFKKAKNVSPCILFFDEIDSLTQNKEDLIGGGPKVLDQLLTELDNVSLKDIIFIAATNRPDLIDKSFLRSGRIDKIIEFKIPSAKERKEIIDLLIKKTPHEKININLIVEETDGFVGADLSLLITDATLLAIKQNKYKETKLKEEHIITILKKMKSHNKGGKNKASDDFRNDKSIAKYIQ